MRGSERYTDLFTIYFLTDNHKWLMFLKFYDNGIKKIGYFSNDYENSLVFI